MKGFIGRSCSVLALALVLGTGCTHMKNLHDPCYPERYWASSRDLVNQAMAPQVQNGHILDQTIWNEHFEPGTDVLNGMGLQKLATLARRRPHPDPVIFLQTAQDLPYDQNAPQMLVVNRTTLDNKRKAAIEQFLNAQIGGQHMTFNVVIHDPGQIGLPGVPAQQTINAMYYTRFQGGLATGGGGGGGAAAVGGGGTGASVGGGAGSSQ